MKDVIYQYIRVIVYLLVEKIGFGASILGAFMFIGGPILLHQGKIFPTFFNVAMLISGTLICGGIGTIFYFLHKHLMIRWQGRM